MDNKLDQLLKLVQSLHKRDKILRWCEKVLVPIAVDVLAFWIGFTSTKIAES